MKARLKTHYLISKQHVFARLKRLKGCLLPDMLNGLKACLACQVPMQEAMQIASELAGWGITPLCWKSAVKQKAFLGWDDRHTAVWFHTWHYPKQSQHFRLTVYRNYRNQITLDSKSQISFLPKGH